MTTEAKGKPPYAHAPIVEAVIELRVELPDGTSLDDLLAAHAGEEERYPKQERRMLVLNQVGVTDDGLNAQTTGQQIGHVFTSADGKNIYHARLDGFSFSRLAPYERWSSFIKEALRLWRRYCDAVQPVRVTRVGARYINQIDVPTGVDVKDYFRTYVEVSSALPQDMLGFFLQVAVPLPDFGANAAIISTPVPPRLPEGVSFLLDVDCWRDTDMKCSEAGFDEEMEALLNTLREAKNHVFESCITPRTEELFD